MATKTLACVADETKPRYSPSANQWPLTCSAPRMLPKFFIIGSNCLLNMAVISCTMIGRVDLMELCNHGSTRSTCPIMVHERTAICKSQLEPIIKNLGNVWGLEQVNDRWFADGLYRGLVLSATQATKTSKWNKSLYIAAVAIVARFWSVMPDDTVLSPKNFI